MPGFQNGLNTSEEVHLKASRYSNRRDKQRQDLVNLIERFYHQVRYGCQNPACHVSTCRSCRDRLSGPVPYRVPTSLTARAIASFLASLSSPQDHLCPHPLRPKTDKYDLAFNTSKTLSQLNAKFQKDLTKEDGILSHWLSNSDGLEALIEKVKEIEKRQMHHRLDANAVALVEETDKEGLDEVHIDIKSFAQKLFSTTSWRLSSMVETFRGYYRMGPAFSLDSYDNETIFLTGNQTSDLKDHFTVHPQIGIYKVPRRITMQSNRPKPFGFTKFGQSIVGLYGLKMRRQLMDTGRTSPFGPKVLLTLVELNSQSESAIRLVPEILRFPSAILEYAREPSISKIPGSTNIRTVALAYLVQEFVVLLNAEREPQVILPSLAECLQNVRCVPGDGPPSPSPAAAAHIVNIALAALIARLFIGTTMSRGESWAEFIACRQQGHCLPHHSQKTSIRKGTIELMAAFQDDLALDLARAIFRALAEYNYRSSIYLPCKTPNETARFHPTPTIFMMNVLRFLRNGIGPGSSRQMAYGRIMLEWARSIFLVDWDGAAEFSWSSDLGCAIDFMCQLYENRISLCFEQQEFEMPVLYDKMDFLEVAKAWMFFEPSTRKGHLLDYPWLFTSSAVVVFFRSINIFSMFKAYEKSVMMGGLLGRMGIYMKESQKRLLEQLHISTTSFLVLEIRRDNILGDALNQLWRRQKRELTRPLKVRMGMDEGEEGFDLGGVQQEFFRLAIAEALDPLHGLFTIDEVTRMTWFVPCSRAPLYQYVLVGLLFGLAVYNGLTLPVTFPLAFYRKLLEARVRTNNLQNISDGWPTLAKSLAEMLSFQGSVEDVYVRQYVFSFESHGVHYDIDMQKYRLEHAWPPQTEHNVASPESKTKVHTDLKSPHASQAHDEEKVFLVQNVTNCPVEATFRVEEAAMVTNKNRHQYVSDYIGWLVDRSIAPEYNAFATGFYLPLQKKSLQLFSAEALRALIEGVQGIDIDGLQRVTTYEDGYHAQHRCIKDFWGIVKEFTLEEKKLLLEFVTASERVPVRGIQEMTFIVQRHGVSDERLPASSTCFGRLLLPEYSTREIMEKKLKLAIVNNRGFGYQ